MLFFAYFSVPKKRNIKRSPNGMKPSGAIFLEQTRSRGLGVEVKQPPRRPQGWRAPPLLGAHLSRGPLGHPSTYFFLLYIPTYPENIRSDHENLIPLPQPSVPVRSHLGGLFRSSAGGGIDHGGLLHQHHSLSDDV